MNSGTEPVIGTSSRPLTTSRSDKAAAATIARAFAHTFASMMLIALSGRHRSAVIY